jgi:hypothetical protein
MLQGKCFLVKASNATYEELTCPSPPPPLIGGACHRADMCRGISDEGCCVGCDHPMRTSITAGCAKKIEAATSCALVKAALDARGCTLH